MSKKEQPNYYAIIPATVRYDTNLKSAEKLLYGEITALANKNGYCFAQNKYFADLYNVTLISVSRWISHLQELGYIKTDVIRNENKEIISRNIYIVDIPYYQKNQYPYIQKSKEGINKNVKDNNIKYNIDDIFYLIINNSNEIPMKFLEIIEKLGFNYQPYMIEHMNEDKMDYIFNEKVNFEDFKLLVKTLDIRIKELKECPSIKLEFLIDQNLIEFNLNNFEYIKENLESKFTKYIISNIDAYIENIDEYDISGYEEQLLRNTEISKEKRANIANSIDISILKNTDIIELIMQEIINTNNKEINKRILNDSDINFETKIKFVKIILLKTTDKEVVTEYIHSLGEEYADINTSKNACSLEYNTQNMELCDVLKEKGYISSFKKGKKKNIIIYNKVNR